MKLKPVHIHPNRHDRDFNLFLLLIPALVFALVLALLVSINLRLYKKEEIATTQEPSVLGEESSVDNSTTLPAP